MGNFILANLLLDVDSVCEFVGVANEEIKKEIAGHVATIGVVSLNLNELARGEDIDEEDNDEEKVAPEIKLKQFKGQLLAALSALDTILGDYDVRNAFNLSAQILAFAKCSDENRAEVAKIVFGDEAPAEEDEESRIAYLPLTQGVIREFYDCADTLFRYKITVDDEEISDEEELDFFDETDLDRFFGLADEDDDDDDDDETGEEWKHGGSIFGDDE